MKVSFSKYHGTGNDFIIINNFEQKLSFTCEQRAMLCHRYFGVGADGLIYLSPSIEVDFEMKFFNSDGREGTLCGNGSRCIVAMANRLAIINEHCEYIANKNRYSGHILKTNRNITSVRVGLNNVSKINEFSDFYVIDTGSPHYVRFVEDLETIDVFNEGKRIRWSKRFQPNGINVNFVSIQDDQLMVRTFERGVENVTLSCGTGVTASAIAYALKKGREMPFYNISTMGGPLRVSFKKVANHFIDVELEGEATHVFDASIDLP